MALEMALRLAAAGYRLAPVTVHRTPNGRKRPNYHGLSWDQAATTDPDQLEHWARHLGPGLGFLVVTGDIVVVDLDVKVGECDGLTWWADQGLPIGFLRVDTPSGGQHHYWRMPAGLSIPNSTGAIAPGIDIRGVGGHVYAPGTRVVGDMEPYRVLDSICPPEELPELPDEVFKAIPPSRRKPRAPAVAGRRAIHDEPWVIRECQRQLALVRESPAVPGSGFRGRLMGAAMMLGRSVAAGIGDRPYAVMRLSEAVETVWGRVDSEDQEWIETGLDDGEGDPWTVVAVPDPPLSASLGSSIPGADGPEEYAAALKAEVLRARLRRDAAAVLAAEDVKPLVVLDAAAFLDSPIPEWLVPGFLYRASTAKVYGPPGSAKSFLLLDLALCLATGREWHGQVLPRTRVHYVMAEGQAVNALRARAWQAYHGVSRDELIDWFFAIPQGVLLTTEGAANYLGRVANDPAPGLVILDTKNRMMAGEENSASDVAVMIRAMDAIRETCDACVVLVDHTGLTDQTRGRGSNAVEAAMDTEVRVSYDTQTLVATASVTRDKAGQPGTSVAYRFVPVPQVPVPKKMAVPVVCVPTDADAKASLLRSTCWAVHRDALPGAVAQMGGATGDAACDVFRALVEARDVDGLTVGQIRTLLADSPRQHSRTRIYAAVSLLGDIGVLTAAARAKNWVLARAYAGWFEAGTTGQP